MAVKAVTRPFLAIGRAENGTVMIEAAFFIPAIMLLLLAGADLARVVQLTRGVDRAAALLADDLSQRDALAEGDVDAALAAADNLIGASGFPAQISLSVKALRLHPLQGEETLWTRSRSTDAVDCVPDITGLSVPDSAASGSAAINYLIQIDLCAEPVTDFFLSGVLSLSGVTLHGRALSLGRSPAVRGLD